MEATRNLLMIHRRSFSFETVMSHQEKVDFLGEVKEAGYRTYLYFVATESPLINIARIKIRVSEGGHFVPDDKVISRYHRTLALLKPAIRRTNRAFIFDNSGAEARLIAEIENGVDLRFASTSIPAWFQRADLD